MTGRALAVANLTVSFGDVRAVNDLTLTIDASGCSGMIGPNGSGKTSFLNAVSGFVSARGSVELDGRPIRLGHPRSAVTAGIARTFQTPQTFENLTCSENVLLGMAKEGGGGITAAWLLRPRMHRVESVRLARAAELLELVGLASLATVPAGQLAYGEQRRLELARALASRPSVVLLDEPAAGLNQAETTQLAGVIEEVRRTGIAFFLVEHKLDFVTRLCESLAVLALGHVIAQGAPAEVLRDAQVMDAYLGKRASA